MGSASIGGHDRESELALEMAEIARSLVAMFDKAGRDPSANEMLARELERAVDRVLNAQEGDLEEDGLAEEGDGFRDRLTLLLSCFGTLTRGALAQSLSLIPPEDREAMVKEFLDDYERRQITF
jgi:hypothetical protein